jgi:hypothetical protein
MRFSARLHEGDMVYCGFWLVLMGSMMGSILWVMCRIEKNTRV